MTHKSEKIAMNLYSPDEMQGGLQADTVKKLQENRMIYTITFNPSLDYYMTLNSFEEGGVNRTAAEEILPGGKGINVSIVLNTLGIPNTALGYIAGFTGDEIERRLKETGCAADFIRLGYGTSRINVKLLMNQNATNVNAGGPVPDKTAIAAMKEKLEAMTSEDILVLAGAPAQGMPEYAYQQILEIVVPKNVTTVVDCTGRLLLNTLSCHPFLIKPNREELSELFSARLLLKDDIISCAKKLQNMGARNVLVSLGSEGAILVTEDGQVMHKDAPSGVPISNIGSGDSMVAGFIYGYTKTGDYAEAFKMGIAAGSACCFSGGLPQKEDILFLRNRLQ